MPRREAEVITTIQHSDTSTKNPRTLPHVASMTLSGHPTLHRDPRIFTVPNMLEPRGTPEVLTSHVP